LQTSHDGRVLFIADAPSGSNIQLNDLPRVDYLGNQVIWTETASDFPVGSRTVTEIEGVSLKL
jgi:hypothetical protein